MNELSDRLVRAQQAARSNGLAAFVLAAGDNIQYFTGITEPSIHACGVLVIPAQGRPSLAVMWLDAGAAAQVPGFDIVTYTQANEAQVIVGRLHELGAAKEKIGMDSRAMEVIGNRMRRLLPDAEPAIAARQIGTLRLVKSAAEIKQIERACRIVAESMKSAHAALKPGISELELACRIEEKMTALGAERSQHPMMIASGERARYIHPFATTRRIADGDMVIIDIGAVSGGYNSDMARTFFLGKPASDLNEAYGFLRRLEEVMLGCLKPGIDIKELVALATGTAKDAGYELVGPVGHGVGLRHSEYAHIEVSPRTDPDLVPRENMVFALFQGSLARGDMSLGVRFEDTVLITGSGARVLTALPEI